MAVYTRDLRAALFLISACAALRAQVQGDAPPEIETLHESVTVHESPGYLIPEVSSATKTPQNPRDIPQSLTAVTAGQMQDQNMVSIGDVIRYVPGVTAIQGENNRDQLVIRGNSTSADFFLDGSRDDVQYFRDIYNAERVEVLKGPNAMIFGRGGGGGVINRVSKRPDAGKLRSFSLEGGSWGNRRFTLDAAQPLGDRFAARINAILEDGGTFRNGVNLKRYGVAPGISWHPSGNTRLIASFENFRDFRTADRGIPSLDGLPIETAPSTFFGRQDQSHVRALVNIGTLDAEHQFTPALTIRNHTLAGDYNRGYQNFVPGAVTADALSDSLSGYNNATVRRNMFNQTDVTWRTHAFGRTQTVLGGAEEGHQASDNFRNTAYFNNASTSILVPLRNPSFAVPVVFRQSPTDADNHVTTSVTALYLQDQVALSSRLQLIAGVRGDRFNLRYRDNRSGLQLSRTDNLLSPRAGVIFRAAPVVSLYASYSVSWLPSSGDQFSSLTTITSQVKAEKFSNYEAGVKLDATRSLFFTLAAYQLDRTNTRSIDPNDATRIIQTGSQRTRGVEAGLTGSIGPRWEIAGGYSSQNALVVSATASARAGARVAQVPRNTFSIWNNVRVVPRLSAGLGVTNRSSMFAAIDNTVTLPGYTRTDAALFFRISEHARLQANVENLTGRRYFLNADNSTNISPGSPRALHAGVAVRF